MIKESKDQSDRDKLLEPINSDQFKKQFPQEILQSENGKKLQEYTKWGLTDNVIKRREKLINEELAFWKERSPSTSLYLEKTHNMFWPILDILSALRPISDEIISDFIAGWAMSRFIFLPSKLNKDQEEEINQLMRPSLIIFKEFLSTQIWREYLVNLAIPESSTTTIKFSPFVEETVNTRDVILSFIRDKKAIPFSKHEIELLKKDYRKEQMRYVDTDQSISYESKSLPVKNKPRGRKPSVAKPVKGLIIGMDDRYKDIFLSDLKRDIKCNSPVELVFMLKALVELGYVYQGVRRELFLSFLAFYGREPDFVSVSGQNDDWNRKNKELLNSMKNLISIIIERNIIT